MSQICEKRELGVQSQNDSGIFYIHSYTYHEMKILIWMEDLKEIHFVDIFYA